MSELLSCEALTKCYDKDKTALDGVDLHVNFGRIVGLLGLSLIHISEPTRHRRRSRMPSSA